MHSILVKVVEITIYYYVAAPLETPLGCVDVFKKITLN
jgi:hypothetical protein